MQTSFLVDQRIWEDDLTEFIRDNLQLLIRKHPPSRFESSKFKPLVVGSPHDRGAIGEKIVRMLAIDSGLSVEKSSTADVKINGIDIEVKFARQKEDGGYLVNQLRDQDYRYVIIIALNPYQAYIFTVPKEIMWSLGIGQHGGNGAKETRIYGARDNKKLLSDLGQYQGINYFKQVFHDKA